MKSRRITLIVAVVLAVATGVLTLRYLSSVNKQSQAQVVEMKPVVVASVAIAVRTKLKPQMLTKVMRPVTLIEPGSIDDPKEVEGDVALIDIPAGSPLTQSKVGVPATIGVTGRLKPGQRAVSIPVDMVKSVSGLVEPGDRVDVMASLLGSGTRSPHTSAIIRGATVLAVNSTIDPDTSASPAPAGGAPAPPPSTVTLAVSAAQADLLTVADLNANLRLALRSPDESVRSLPAEAIDLSVPPVAAAAVPVAAPPAQPASQAKPAPQATNAGVLFIDGDKSVIVPR